MLNFLKNFNKPTPKWAQVTGDTALIVGTIVGIVGFFPVTGTLGTILSVAGFSTAAVTKILSKLFVDYNSESIKKLAETITSTSMTAKEIVEELNKLKSEINAK
jgi:hypothetical protein